MLRSPCRIVHVGTRRDGGQRYWCVAHKADATGKYGVESDRCRYAGVEPISEAESMALDLRDYPGGVALWGAVPAVYDTTRRPMDRGIHVHARKALGAKKVIDHTYRRVRIAGVPGAMEPLAISELDAIYGMVSQVFGHPLKYITCPRCGEPHLDKDWFSVHPHRRHLCAGCGVPFPDVERAVGNPACRLTALAEAHPRRTLPATSECHLRQRDYPGGIQIWGSNPALLWTARQPERSGIHVHAYDTDDPAAHPVVDDTFRRVSIDGIRLEPRMTRFLMAQQTLPHLKGRIAAIQCPSCGRKARDTGTLAVEPRSNRGCARCGESLRAPGRFRNVIANPMQLVFTTLAESSVRPPRTHDLALLPEVL